MVNKLILAVALTISVSSVFAEESAGFEIKGFVVENATLLSPVLLQEAANGFAGPQRAMSDIQGALAAIEQTYAEHGFGAVKAVLPEQELDDGLVRVRVIEATIGQVEIVGNTHFSTENVRRSLPNLIEGTHPDLRAIDAALRVANESAAKQTNLVFRQGEQEGTIDASVRVSDENPLRFAVSADNTGVKGSDGKYATGRYRTGFIVQHANLFDRDHAVSFQYLTSPGFVRDVKIAGLGYRMPLYATGDALEFSYGYSNVNSGKLSTVAGPIGISGSGYVFSAKYDQMFPRWGDWLGKLTYGLDYRIYINKVTAESSQESLIPDATVHPVSVTYSGQLQQEGRAVQAGVTYVHNLQGGPDGRTVDFTKPGGRAEATANYQIWRLNAVLNQSLPKDWVLKIAANGQYTRDALISGEQFGVGGQDSVRGFYERQFANDKGIRASAEIMTAELLAGSEFRLRLLTFYDYGALWRNRVQPGEVRNLSVATVGLGLRGGYGKQFSYRFDWGRVVDDSSQQHQGKSHLHGSVFMVF